MKRRTFLAVSGASAVLGTSGCLDAGALVTGGSPPADEPSPRELSVVRIDDAPDEYGIALDVDLASPRLTDDELPALSIRVENVGTRRVTYGTWHRYRAGGFGYSDPDGLVTITTDEAGRLELDSEGCWSYDDALARSLAARMGTVRPGESHSDDRRVIHLRRDEAADGDCPDPGEYTFTASYNVYDEETRDAGGTAECHEAVEQDPFGFEDGERVECSFTLELAEVRE